MAFDNESIGKQNNILLQKEEGITLPASATTEYSSALDLEMDPDKQDRFITIAVNPSAVTGTNLDIALYGDFEEGGTKVQLKDAIVADVTDSGLVAGQVDLNEYPARKYYVGWTADVNESANTIDVYAIG